MTKLIMRKLNNLLIKNPGTLLIQLYYSQEMINKLIEEIEEET